MTRTQIILGGLGFVAVSSAYCLWDTVRRHRISCGLIAVASFALGHFVRF
jgi:hypothetical protein